MGSGFNFFTNGVDVTPATTGEWTDVDVSGEGVPAGSSGVILEVHNEHTTAEKRVSFRKNGSSDDRVTKAYARTNIGTVFVPIDSNRIFETYLEDSATKLYLIGYTDDAVVYKEPPVDITPSETGVWEDKDLSSEISNAVGVIIQGYGTHDYTQYSGVRCNGSTDEFTYGEQYKRCQKWYIIKVDAEDIIELKKSGAIAAFYLIAYLKSPIVMFTNGKDQSVGTTGAWTDCDVTTDTDADADGAILFLKNAGTGTNHDGNVRKNGSTDNRVNNKQIRGSETAGKVVGCAIGMDSSQIFEYYIDSTDIDIYVIGYCKPEVAVTEKDFSDSGAGSEVFGIPFKTLPFADVGAGADVFAIPFKALGFSDVGMGADVFSVFLEVQFGDTGLGTDVFSKEIIGVIEKSFDDSGAGSDVFSINWKSLGFSDSGTGADVFSIGWKSLAFSDVAAGADSFTIVYKTKFFTDVGTGLDSFALPITQKSFTDLAAGTDVFGRKNVMKVTLPAIIGMTLDGQLVIVFKRELEAES